MFTKSYIPPNINDNGKALNGLISTRKLLEIGILCGAIYLFCTFVLFFLQPIVQMSIMAVLMLFATIICLIGIDGYPLSIGLTIVWNYRKTKAAVTMRMPQPLPEEETESKQKLKLKFKK